MHCDFLAPVFCRTPLYRPPRYFAKSTGVLKRMHYFCTGKAAGSSCATERIPQHRSPKVPEAALPRSKDPQSLAILGNHRFRLRAIR
jgi:hypothetical protein